MITNSNNDFQTAVAIQNQEVIYQSQLHFQKLASISPDFIFIFDVAASKPIYFNHTSILDYTYDEILTFKSLKSIVHSEDLPRLRQVWRQTLQGEGQVCEFRVESKTGKWEWLQGRAAVFERDKAGQVIQLLLTCTLITKRKQVEEALRHERDFTTAILETAASLMVVLDREGRIVRFNRASEQKTGYQFSEVQGKALWDVLLAPTEAIAIKNVFGQLTAENFPLQYENHWITREGQRCFISWSAAAILDGVGDPEFIIATGIDITERQRTLQLKEEFIATVNHELRTPLTAILGALSLILGGAVGPIQEEVKVLSELAHQNSERLLHLINDVLDVSQLEATKLPLSLQTTSLIHLIDQALENHNAYAEQFGVAFKLGHTVPTSLKVRADPDWIAKVLHQLLTNAAKFSPRGSEVMVAVFQNDALLRVEVSDKGPGIPPEFEKQVFQKFSQANNSTTRQTGGAGLGLNISKTIIERHNGQIGFENRPGGGTTFYFELPQWIE